MMGQTTTTTTSLITYSLFFLLLALYAAITTATTGPPPCITNTSEFGYVNDALSSTKTFMNCFDNIPDPTMPASYWNNTSNGVVDYSVAMTLSNLIKIDEVEGTVEMTFSLGLSWTDNRYAMPLFWDSIPGRSVDLTDLLNGDDSINIFMPQLMFPDAQDVDVQIQNVALTQKNIFLVKSAYTVTLVQPGFQFKKYPGDSQTLVVRFYVYPFNNASAVLHIYGDGISFSTDQNGDDTFKLNPIWEYQSYEATTYDSKGSSSYTSYALFNINVKRKGSGIVLRLIVPLLLLVLLATVSFWVYYEERVNVTLAILFSVSALYIVILGNIPLVGYLTDLDRFVFWMFLMLVIVVVVHQMYATVIVKKERWPLRIFLLRILEFFGRVCMLPMIVFYFIIQIPSATDSTSRQQIIAVTITLVILVGFREFAGLYQAWLLSLEGLIEKINQPDLALKDLSKIEIFIANRCFFHIWSISPKYISQCLESGKGLVVDIRSGVQMRHVVKMTALLKNTGGIIPVTAANQKDGIQMSMFEENHHRRGASQDDFHLDLQSSISLNPMMTDPSATSVNSSNSSNNNNLQKQSSTLGHHQTQSQPQQQQQSSQLPYPAKVAQQKDGGEPRRSTAKHDSDDEEAV